MTKNNKTALIDKFYELSDKKTMELCEKEKESHIKTLEPFEVYCERQKHRSMDICQFCVESFSQAFQLIIEELLASHDEENMHNLVQGTDNFKKYMENFTEKEILENGFAGDKTLAEMLGYSVGLMNKIYKIGLDYLEKRKLTEAARIIGLLILLDPGFSASWITMGIILKLDKHWQESLDALNMSMALDLNNPLPYLHAAACYRELNQKQAAKKALSTALDKASSQPKYHNLMKTIRAEQNLL